MSDAATTRPSANGGWYAQAIANNPAERERIAAQSSAARNFKGEPDNLDDIERMLLGQ